MESNTTNNYEYVNHPKHYNNYSKETIDMMVDIFGLENTIMWCEMTAFKYRMRMGTKPDTPTQQDIQKESWYLNKKQELQNKLNNNPFSYYSDNFPPDI